MKTGNAETAVKESRWPDDLPKPERVDEDPDRHLIRYILTFPPNERARFLPVPLPNERNGV